MKTLKYYCDASRQKIWNIISRQKGFKTNRHICVIESDDWGSIRMPSVNALNRLKAKGVKFYTYDRFDSMASNDDITALGEVLGSVKDARGHSAKLTCNCIMANPNFDKIKESGYTEYHYELFTETLNKYPHHDKTMEYFRNGMDCGLFMPQFHGREHLNAQMWLSLLQNTQNIPELNIVRDCFQECCYSMYLNRKIVPREHVLAAFNINSFENSVFVEKSIEEGLFLFQNIFGFKSKSLIAPSYIWDDYVEKVSKKHGVLYIQGLSFQTKPVARHSKVVFHYMGEKNKYQQIYLTRNCSFEPSNKPLFDAAFCMRQIEEAFSQGKPAVISAHRINFIGSLEQSNRDNNLKELKILLNSLIRKYGDVEFLSTDELGDVIMDKIFTKENNIY